MTAITMHILHDDIRTIRLEADTIIPIIHHAILDHNVGRAIRIPPVRVLGRVVALAVPADVQVREDDVAAVGDEVVVLRRVAELEVRDAAAVQADRAEEDGAQDVDVGGVQVVPDLAVAVEGAAAVDVHVRPAELEEGGGVLEGLVEGVGLPVVGVVGELDVALDVCEGQYEWSKFGDSDVPRSMAFRNVRSKAVPMMYVALEEKMTCPPLLQSSMAERM